MFCVDSSMPPVIADNQSMLKTERDNVARKL